MKSGRLVVMALLISFILSGAGFAAEQEKKLFRAVIGPDGVQRVNISSGEYFFDPNYIVVKVNVPVEFIIKKDAGIVSHNIIINAPEAGMNIREFLSTEPKTIKFTPTKTGSYPFYCDVKSIFSKTHKDKGMEGTLEVTE